MSITIPMGDGITPHVEVQIPLDGVVFTLEARWNTRFQSWFLHLFDAEGIVPILTGIRLVPDWLIGSYNVIENGPRGALRLVDTSGANEYPTLEGFGTRWQLRYYTRSEVAAL